MVSGCLRNICVFITGMLISAPAFAQKPIEVEGSSGSLLPTARQDEQALAKDTKNKQEKVEEKRKTPLSEDPKTDTEGKALPQDQSQAVGQGHKRLSVAAVYSANITGAREPEKSGEIYPLAALLEIAASESIAFETGLIFVERQYQVANDNYLLQENVHRIHIPVTLKLWWRDIFAFSVGPYMAFAVSGVESYELIRIVDSDDLETPAADFVEFGFDAGVTLQLPIGEKHGAFVEARFFTPYDTIDFKKYNSVFALAGYKYKF